MLEVGWLPASVSHLQAVTEVTETDGYVSWLPLTLNVGTIKCPFV